MDFALLSATVAMAIAALITNERPWHHLGMANANGHVQILVFTVSLSITNATAKL